MYSSSVCARLGAWRGLYERAVKVRQTQWLLADLKLVGVPWLAEALAATHEDRRQDAVNLKKLAEGLVQATAEKEVDAYLLKKATNAAAQTSGADLATAGLVFVAAFGIGLFFAAKGS